MNSRVEGDLEELHRKYAATRDPALRAALARRYDAFAVAMARRFPTWREGREDLTQVARLGLLQALDRFDPGRGGSFTGFARVTIAGELKRHLRDRTWVLRIPRSLQEHYLAVVRAVDDLTHEQGRSPTIPEVAKWCRLSEEEVLEALELARHQRPLAFSVPGGPDESEPPLEAAAVDDRFDLVDRRLLVQTLLGTLSARDREIVALRFEEGLSQREIAERLGVSQMCISRTLARLLARLKVLARDLPPV